MCLFLLLLGWQSVKGQNDDFIRCYSYENELEMRQKYGLGTIDDFENWLAPLVEAEKRKSSSERVVVTLPVVFHIIHDGEAVGTGFNPAASIIQNQLDQLNFDFRKTPGTAGDNSNPVGADTEIEFCMATVDPNGNTMPEPGINRIDRNAQGWTAPPYGVCIGGSIDRSYIDNTIKPQSQWDPNNYINIWVMDLNCGLLGYAQFPNNSGLGGLGSNNGGANTDGVVIITWSMGSVGNPFPGAPTTRFDEGRTLTHELGHFFGLRHIWGDATCGNDFCNDTPTQQTSSSGCPNTTTCDGQNDMVENYMDYSDDDCMNIFTVDQKARMQAVMNNSPRRGSLTASTACSSGPPGNTAPTASFTANPTTGIMPLPVNVDASASSDPQGDNLTYSWNFGDGNTASGVTASNTYANQGAYTITLTVSDGFLTDQATETITVNSNISGPCVGCVDFSSTATVSYSNQDAAQNVTVQDNGATLFMQDNTWRRTTVTYDITPNTMIDFEFASNNQGEIHGIGFDQDDNLASDGIFQVYGTQNWANRDFDYTGGGNFQSFTIPVGTYFTGNNFFLVLVNDNDAGSGNNSFFRNVRIYEDGTAPPADPSGLNANATSSSSIDLSWIDNSGDEDNFIIERDAGGGFSQIATVGANVTSYTDNGLAASTTYTYRVAASNAGGNSGYSNQASATTDAPPPTPPAAPSGLSASTASSTQINLSWNDNSGDEDNFIIERDGGSGFSQIATVGANVTSYNDTGLNPSTTYTYRVAASNGVGTSGYSNQASATTDAPPPTIPNAPSSLSATDVSSSQIDLSWTDNSNDEDNFVIERDGGSGFVQIATVGANVTSYSDNGLAASTTYTYRVAASNTAGTSAFSNQASATTQAGGGGPCAGCIDFSTTGTVSYSNQDVGQNAQVQDNGATLYLEDNTWRRTTQTYNVTANTMIDFEFRSTIQGEIHGIGFDPDDNLGSEGIFQVYGTQNWANRDFDYTDVGNFQSFTIPVGTYFTGNNLFLVLVNDNDASSNNNNSFFRNVRIYENGGGTTIPNAPSGLSANAVSSSQINLSWDDNSGDEDNFVIERDGGGGFSQIATVGANTTSYSDGSLNASTTYTYRVAASNTAGTSGYSNQASATTDNGGGGCSTVTIDSNDFESGWGNWNDGGSDCRRNINDAAFANSGNFCVRLRDNTTTSVMTTDNFDLSSFEDITVAFSYITNSMDNASEDFWLQISTNGGASFTTVEEWNLNDEFVNNVRENDQVTIPGPFSSTTQIRFRCDASANGDQVYIDDVVITGCTNGNRQLDRVGITENNDNELAAPTLSGFNVYPNPTKGFLNVEYSLGQVSDVRIIITDMTGRIVVNRNANQSEGKQSLELDTQNWAEGLYNVFVGTKHQRFSKRIVVAK